MAQALVRVRAQAYGGKYLGPAVKATPPLLTAWIGGQQVPMWVNGTAMNELTFPTGSSGPPMTLQPSEGDSPNPVLVQPLQGANEYYPTPGFYWLQPPADGQADLTFGVELAGPTAVELRVQAFASDDQSRPVYGCITPTLLPGVDYTQQEPGFVVPLVGLRVTNFTATLVPFEGVEVSADVAMMCGCKITAQPRSNALPAGTEPQWPSNEFQVWALFFPQGQESQPPVATLPLQCDPDTPSSFAGLQTVKPGTYTVWLAASQNGSPNSGGAVTTVSVA